MHKIIYFSILAFFTLNACKKSNQSAGGKLSITKVGGNTITTKYTDTPIPSNNGYFSLQYQKYGSGAKYHFFILVDANNNGGLNIDIPRMIQTNTIYTSELGNIDNSNRVYVSFYGDFFNADVNNGMGLSRTEVVFESFTYPGKIKGAFKQFNQSGVLTYTGLFDFIAK
ncbi:MAG: hypothetical protein RLZ47_51 [Bacteroidota bacterium]